MTRLPRRSATSSARRRKEDIIRRIRLLFTIPNFDTAGSGKVLLQLAERLDRTHFEPHICCTHHRGAFFEQVRKSGIPVHIREFTSAMQRRATGLLGCWRLSRFFKQFDLVHSFHYSDDYSEALAARMAGVKWIYVKKNMMWGGNGWRLRTRLAHGIVAQNSDMMRAFFPRSRKTVLIPFGVDTAEYAPRPRSSALYSEFGLSDETRVVLVVANLVPVKGVDGLIRAFQSIADGHPTTRLFIVGDDRGPYAGELHRQAATGPAAARIVFTGKRHDVPAFHSIADVLVQPSLETGEGSPLKSPREPADNFGQEPADERSEQVWNAFGEPCSPSVLWPSS